MSHASIRIYASNLPTNLSRDIERDRKRETQREIPRVDIMCECTKVHTHACASV